ncbi:MAG: hypothetical protein ABI458_03775 [Chloroflexota bacterium]
MSGAELRLQVNQPTLHLNVQDLVASLQDEIGGTSISSSDRVLQSHAPGSMRLGNDCLDRAQLTSVAQRDAIGRE